MDRSNAAGCGRGSNAAGRGCNAAGRGRGSNAAGCGRDTTGCRCGNNSTGRRLRWIGGRLHDKVLAMASIHLDMDDLDWSVREFTWFREQGYRVVKGGWGKRPESVFGINRNPRSAYSEISVRFDPKYTGTSWRGRARCWS